MAAQIIIFGLLVAAIAAMLISLKWQSMSFAAISGTLFLLFSASIYTAGFPVQTGTTSAYSLVETNSTGFCCNESLARDTATSFVPVKISETAVYADVKDVYSDSCALIAALIGFYLLLLPVLSVGGKSPNA